MLNLVGFPKEQEKPLRLTHFCLSKDEANLVDELVSRRGRFAHNGDRKEHDSTGTAATGAVTVPEMKKAQDLVRKVTEQMLQGVKKFLGWTDVENAAPQIQDDEEDTPLFDWTLFAIQELVRDAYIDLLESDANEPDLNR